MNRFCMRHHGVPGCKHSLTHCALMFFQLQVHCCHVLLARSLTGEHHVAEVTLQVPDLVVNGFDVIEHGQLVVELPAAHGALVILDALVNGLNVLLVVGLASDEGSTDLTGHGVISAKVSPISVGL